MKTKDATRVEWPDTDSVRLGPHQLSETLPAAPNRGTRVGHLSDFHLGKPIEDATVPGVVRNWLEHFGRAGVELVVLSGDLVERPGWRSPMLRIRGLLEESELPWVAIPGNHDVARPGSNDAFYELFGEYPRVERRAGLEIVLLDTMAGLPAAERRPFDRLEAMRRGSFSQGRVGRAQLRTAASLLDDEPERPRLLLLHHHLRPEGTILDEPPASGAPEALMVPCLDAERVTEWAENHDIRLAFHGHKHAWWPPYVVGSRTVVLNSGSSTRGKPIRRARIVDLADDGTSATIWELVDTDST